MQVGKGYDIPFEQFIALTNSEFAQAFQDHIGSLRLRNKTDAAAKLVDIYREKIWKASDKNLVPADLAIGKAKDGGHSLQNIGSSKQFTDLLSQRKKHAERGAERNAFYERCLQPLIKLADRVEVIDPYAAEAIVKKRDWLVSRLMTDVTGYLAITTNMQKSGEDRYSSDPGLRGHLEQVLSKKLDEENFSGKSLNVKIMHVHRDFHDRFLLIKFKMGAFGLALPGGIDDFSSRTFSTGFVPKEYSQAELTDYLWVLGNVVPRLCDDIKLVRLQN